ncbi:hypothetical protein G5C51_19960 [Streptomyces sp. A7024]|uniref:Gram-positive cocci surface proteins LPxTG domain-containing protein n=1 Tax=Streptomyces coryli TaxID=1128680 RepID=A0A6G4U334_9ACTN|nr:hypothetical protein [Streptomyces coryli]NGN66160.1 hypothetical protein [Streptomyces coryli]
MDRMRRLPLVAGLAAPLLIWGCLGPTAAAVPADRPAQVEPPAPEEDYGTGDGSYGEGSYNDGSYNEGYVPEDPATGPGPAAPTDGKNPGQAPGNVTVPDFGTFTPPPQGDSDDTPALAAASLAAMSLGGAAFILRRARRTTEE